MYKTSYGIIKESLDLIPRPLWLDLRNMLEAWYYYDIAYMTVQNRMAQCSLKGRLVLVRVKYDGTQITGWVQGDLEIELTKLSLILPTADQMQKMVESAIYGGASSLQTRLLSSPFFAYIDQISDEVCHIYLAKEDPLIIEFADHWRGVVMEGSVIYRREFVITTETDPFEVEHED